MGSQVLETAAGLAFFYAAVSGIVAALVEFIATEMRLRARILQRGLESLLGLNVAPNNAFALAIISHPLVKPYETFPSYVPPANFASAVLEVLDREPTDEPPLDRIKAAIGAVRDENLRRVFRSAVLNAAGDIKVLHKEIATWYEEAMGRLSGDYKRLAFRLSIAVGLLLSLALKLDTFQFVKALWVNQVWRAGLLASAAGAKQDLPAGDLFTKYAELFGVGVFQWGGDGQILAFAGCVLTAIAVGFGAPFWFDLLSKFLRIRGTGETPPKVGKVIPDGVAGQLLTVPFSSVVVPALVAGGLGAVVVAAPPIFGAPPQTAQCCTEQAAAIAQLSSRIVDIGATANGHLEALAKTERPPVKVKLEDSVAFELGQGTINKIVSGLQVSIGQGETRSTVSFPDRMNVEVARLDDMLKPLQSVSSDIEKMRLVIEGNAKKLGKVQDAITDNGVELCRYSGLLSEYLNMQNERFVTFAGGKEGLTLRRTDCSRIGL